jgi:hypothetical protein
MSFVRLLAPESIGFAALLSVTALALTAGATEQVGPPTEPDGYRLLLDQDDYAQLRDNATPHDATEGDVWDPVNCEVSPAGETTASRAGPRGRPFVAVLIAVPLATFAEAQGPRGSEILTPADRFATSQLIGVGYVVNPQFRFGVMGIFNEVVTGLPSGVDAWQFGGIAPIAIGTFEHFIIGGGPVIGYRSGGQQQADVGAVVLSGASIPLGKGLALNIAVPVTALLAHRVTVSVGVAVGVAKVF